MESGDEDDELTMGEKDWQKMNRTLWKQGYREGKSEGREKGMQAAFESASTLSMKHSLKVGQVYGLIEWSLAETKAETERTKLQELLTKVSSHLENIQKVGGVQDPVTLEASWSKSLEDLNNEFMQLKS